jgi:23S rRNA pseudouridine2605 synthase
VGSTREPGRRRGEPASSDALRRRQGPVRLQILLAAAGVASRRGAEALLREGRVTVNGRPAQLGQRADPQRDRVAVDGRTLRSEARAYWVLHKPRGVVTTRHDPEGRPTVLDLLPAPARHLRLFPVGRLDRDSEGLLLLTNDGEVAHALLHPSLGSEREYRVVVRGRLEEAAAQQLAAGVQLPEGRTAPARLGPRRYDPAAGVTRLVLVLREGRRRQIRRSLEELGHPVLRLVRTRVGPLELGELRVGEARPLGVAERRRLLAHAGRLLGAGFREADRPHAAPRATRPRPSRSDGRAAGRGPRPRRDEG